MTRLSLMFASLLLSTAAHALTERDPVAVCDRISTNAETIQCLQIVNNAHYIDRLAAGACDRISTNADTVSCMAAISNRAYSREMVEACDRVSTNQDTIECLATTGSRYNGGGEEPGTQRVVDVLREAKKAVREGRVSLSLDLIDRAIDFLRY